MGSELAVAEQLLSELKGPDPRGTPAPTMGRLQRVSYTHDAMIDLIIAHPEMDQNHIAAYFGYTASWISNILASDAFQTKMAARREEVIDPEMKASMEERFRALAIRSLQVLQNKLNQTTVSDTVALRCAELGAKALGMGVPQSVPGSGAGSQDRLERLAERLVQLQSGVKERVIGAQDGVQATFIEGPRPQASEGGEVRRSSAGEDVAGQGAGSVQTDAGGSSAAA